MSGGSAIDARRLADTAHALVAGDRGLLAMDESGPTCDKRFAALGIAQTEAMRRAWRDLIVTTPRLSDCISGAILFDETIHQTTLAGVPFAQALECAGIVPGIKVDAGAKPLAGFDGEQVTEGLDGLRERLAAYAAMGARFAKWRAVIRIGDPSPGRIGDGSPGRIDDGPPGRIDGDGRLPSAGCIAANAHALARYAGLCQQAGLVPIVEPEVLMDGDHGLARCARVSAAVLHAVFAQLHEQRVLLEGLLLKPAMVLPGADHAGPASVEAVADATVECLLRHVPAAVPGIVFLSGGQAAERASAHLDAMNRRFGQRAPWPLAFSFARAVQQPALEWWRGEPANVAAAQAVLFHRADCNRAARRGGYDAAADAPARR